MTDALSPDPAGALATWAPKRRLSLNQAVRRSHFIARLRVGLWIVMGLALAVPLGQIAFESLTRGQRIREIIAPTDAVRMTAPRFTGRREDGTRYILTADAAVRRRDEVTQVDLENVAMRDDNGIVVSAPKGSWDQSKSRLALDGGVVFDGPGGTRYESANAVLDIQADKVVGRSRVTGRSPLGYVSADSYEVVDGGDRIRLKGNVRIELPDRQRRRRE